MSSNTFSRTKEENVQISGMLIFLGIWLLILWLGSIALEVTGLERTRARFQALSALSGTGFTTREAESIVNHPKRRMIISWLIFLGNIGVVSFIIAMILFLKAGLTAPTLAYISILLILLIIFILIIWLGIMRRISNAVVNLFRKGQKGVGLDSMEILHQVGEYGVARLAVSEKTVADGSTLGNTNIKNRDVTILAIEKADKSLPFPGPEVGLASGDCLLCYGKLTDLMNLRI
jgi:Trk-type K+ transport system membrane component